MKRQSYCLRIGSVLSAFVLFSAFTASAANGTWNGTQSAFWTNSLNWSASPFPVGVDTALFTSDGNGQRALDLTGFLGVKFITFDSLAVAAYTNGAGAVNSQTLIMADSGEFKISSTAGNSQVFNCGVQLGADRSAQSYSFRNDNPAQLLTFNDVFGCGSDLGNYSQGTKTLTINGSGPVAILGNIQPAVNQGLILTDANSGTLTLAGSNVVITLNMNGGPSSVIDIGSKELFLNSLGGTVLNCTLGGTITGTGKLRMSTIDGYSSANYDYANCSVSAGKTLVINPEITGLGGFEMNSGAGTFVLNGTNTFEGHVNFGVSGGTISASRIGNRGSVTSNFGKGTNLYFAATGRLLYTGTGETSDRVIVMNANPTIDQSGPSGKLSFSTTPTLTAARTLTLQGSSAGVGEFSAPLANTGSSALTVVKAGEGTWIFSRTNTYTGTTSVNGGKLLINSPGSLASGSAVAVANGAVLGGSGIVNGGVTVAAGGTLAPGDVNTVGTLSLGGTLSLASATLLFDVSNVATDKLAVTGALTLSGTNTIVLSIPGGTLPTGSYTLMTFASRTGTGSFVLSPAYVNASLSTNATSVKLDVVNTGVNGLTWKGTVSGSWDGTDLNWTNGSDAVAYTPGAVALFDDTAASYSVGSASPVFPGSVLFNNSVSNYSIDASVGGTGVVFKLGSGAVTLTGNNTFTGQTTIVAGSLTIGGAGVLGGGNYATNIVDNGDLNYASSVAQTNSGVISGAGSLTSSGSGTLTLSGTNTYAGPTIINAGVLRVQSITALGGTAWGTTVAAGAKLELAGSIAFAAEPLDLSGTLSNPSGSNTYAGAISLQPGSSFDVGANAFLIISGSTAGIGTNNFSKTGTGTLRFTADPNHLGVCTVAEGTLELQHGGNADAPFVINPGATLREITASDLGDYYVQADGILDMRASDQIGGLRGSGTVTIGAAGSYALTVGGNNESAAFSGVIQNGSGTMSLTKTQTGVQTLSGASTYSGGTTLSGGQLNINNGGTGGTSSAIGTGTFTIGGGFTIDNSSAADVTLSPVIAQNWNGDFFFVGTRSLNLGTGAVTLNANRTVTIMTNTLSVGGAIGGAFSLTKNGAGTLALSGANTYSGATTVNGGTLLVNSPGSLASGSAVTVNSGTLGGSGIVSGTVNVAVGCLLAPGGVNAIGTLTLANNSASALTLNGSTLLFDLSSVAGTCDKIAITNASGKLVLNGTNTIALSFPAGVVPAGTYTLMTCAGGITTNAGAVLKLQGAYPNAALSVVGNNVVLTTTGAGVSGLTWKGNVSGSWDGSDLNWTNGSASVAFADGNAVTFDDTALGNFSVSSAGAVAPASVQFNNSLNPYAVSAAISGTAPLVKQGSGAVTLSGLSAYNPSSVTVSDGTLTFSGASQLNGGSYAGSILNNSALNYASSAAQVNSGTISGGGSLTLSANATLTLAGSNFYSGVTYVNAGILKIQHPYALGTVVGGTIVAPGATLQLAGDISTLGESLALSGTLSSQTGNNTYGGTVTLATGAAIDVGAGSTLILKAFQANGPFVKNGAGTLRFTADPNGNGLMTVNAGVAELAANTMDGNVVVNAGATLIGNFSDCLNIISRVSVNAGGFYVLRQSDSIGGLAGAGTVTRDSGGPGGIVSPSAILTVGGNNLSETFSGVMQDGYGTLGFSKMGIGVQTLTGASTYTGPTTVSNGTLLVTSPGTLAADSAVMVFSPGILGGNGTVNGAVTIALGGYLAPGALNSIGTLTLGSTLLISGSALLCDVPASGTAADQVAVAGALTLEGVNPVVLSFADGAAQAGDYTLMTFASKSGSGSFALFGSYPNATLVLSDTNLILRIAGGSTYGLTWNGNQSALWDGGVQNWRVGSAAASYTAGDAVLFDDTAAAFTVGSVGAVTPSSVLINNSANLYFIAAPISGTAPLVKSGTGTATLNGVSTYNPSALTLNGGMLSLANAAQLNSGNYAGAIINNGVFNHYATTSQILSGNMAGLGSVTKNNSGTLVLSGANTHSGGTTVSSGVLYGKASSTAFGLGVLTLGGGTVEVQNDTAMAFTNNVTVSATTAVKAGRVSYGAGVAHSLGALTIGNVAMNVSTGSNVSANTPYGLTFGAVTLTANSATFDVPNNGTGLGTLTLGALGGSYNVNKSNSGLLYLGTAGSRGGGTTTLTAGTLKLGHAAGLGTTSSSLQLNGGIFDLAIDTTVNAINTTVGGSMTIQSDKATAASAGITHTLGTLSMGAYTLTVTNGANVSVNSSHGLTFGTTTLTGAPVFDVGNNGTGAGILTLGVVGGNFVVTKKGTGTLQLTGVNTYNTATLINSGRVLGVSGGSSASSAVTVQSSGIAGAIAKLGVLCSAANGKWTCASLLTTNAVSPATANPVLEFTFGVTPSTTVAPLQVAGTATFAVTPGVTVYLRNLGNVPAGTYPLMLVGGTAPAATPALTIVGGYSGSTLSWSGNTLNLILAGTNSSPLTWATGAAGSGTWDANNSANTVWLDSAAGATFYQEPTGPGAVGDRVVFDDSNITTNTTVTLNSFVTPASVFFNTVSNSYTLTGLGGIVGTIGLTKAGSNLVTLATANSYTGGTTVAEGTLRLASGGSISHSLADVAVATSVLTNALLKIESGASASGRNLQMGLTNGAVGAVYNQGSLVMSGSTVSNFALGFSGGSYGYYRHDSATPLTITETGIAGSYGGNGVLDVLQGAFTNVSYFLINRGTVQQYGQVNVTGGRFVMPNSNANAALYWQAAASGQGVINVSGNGLLGSAGTTTELDLIKTSTSPSAVGILNVLAGGTVQVNKVKATQAAGTALVNLNGGTLKANGSGFLMLGGSAIDRATVYAQGLTVDTDGKSMTISQPLLAPIGSGVTSIPVTTNGTGYIGRPVVYVSGGGGTGATAVAEFDPASQQVTSITITSPGFGYTGTPSVTITGGGGTAPALASASIGAMASGGLTKVGDGMLSLSGTNTYSGTTTISNGILRLGVANALPTNAAVIVAGGVYDLNGFTVTNGWVNLMSGSIINGKIAAPTLQGADSGVIQARIVSTNGLTKSGTGTLTISAPQAYAGATAINGGTLRLSGRQPGLYEGRLPSNFDLTTANPKTAAPLSTRYANVFFNANGESCNAWIDASTYVYTGYLWNDASTNETWTFYKGFDDSARIMLNGVNILQNPTSSAIVISNATVLAGANTFELRLGQGTGGVGNNNANFPAMGIGFDRMGRGQLVYANFQTLSDPGDGRLLTLTNVFDLASANLLPTGSVVTVAANAMLDLGGTGQSLAGLSGSGTVSNGTLNVTGTVTPAGANVIGTLTLAATTVTLSGTLRVDVSDDGSCDVLSVKGDVNISGLTLNVEDVTQLDRHLQYTVVTCAGTRTGTFGSKNLPSGWIVSYESNGDIILRFAGGTMLRLY